MPRNTAEQKLNKCVILAAEDITCGRTNEGKPRTPAVTEARLNGV